MIVMIVLKLSSLLLLTGFASSATTRDLLKCYSYGDGSTRTEETCSDLNDICSVTYKRLTVVGNNGFVALGARCSELGNQVEVTQVCTLPPATSTETVINCQCNIAYCNKIDKLASTIVNDTPIITEYESDNTYDIFIYVLIPICLLAILILIGYWLYRRYGLCHRPFDSRLDYHGHHNYHGALLSMENNLTGQSEKDIAPFEIIETINRGRFGQVKRGVYNGRSVAIKVFLSVDSKSWMQEQDIYKLPRMKDHEHILRFYAASASVKDSQFFIIADYHVNGSVFDFLKGHSLSIVQGLSINHGIVKGLEFLHSSIAANGDNKHKPIIVHRDFKSKNILLKTDLTPCIADFGLAIAFDSCTNDLQNQVGTRRYMSPEVLEGATQTGPSAFMHIDIYAAGLVLWEVMSRVQYSASEPVSDYKLPFEVEVGLQPTFDQMAICVVSNKGRPILRHYLLNEPLTLVGKSIREMWDSDPDARLSAAAVADRLKNVLENPVVNEQSLVAFCSSNETLFIANPIDVSLKV